MAVDRDKTLRRFGRALAQVRQEAGLSQEELAHRSGLHRTYVGGLERGERNPTLMTVLALAKGLGMPPSTLLKRPFS